MDNIQKSVAIPDPKKGSICIRSYTVGRRVRAKHLELRYHKELQVYFMVEGYFDSKLGKVAWCFSDGLPAKTRERAVAAIEFVVRGWEQDGWEVVKQWIKR